eukprot:8476422-Alexandrium_andersonii.AAC.1
MARAGLPIVQDLSVVVVWQDGARRAEELHQLRPNLRIRGSLHKQARASRTAWFRAATSRTTDTRQNAFKRLKHATST